MLNRQIEETALNRIEKHQRISRLIDSRPTPYSRLVIILYLMGYRQRELVKMLGVTKQAVQATLLRARKDAQVIQ